MSARTLNEWLHYQETLHASSIDLGLERVRTMWRRMCATGRDVKCPVIVVGGTNGKGSTIAYLQAIYEQAGYRSVVYTSPHIDKYNERILISGKQASDAQLIEAFECVEQVRAGTSLSYFEFGTLAALYIASGEAPDVLILEVGLGGRLDAVNILQHDVAIVTNISMDHTDWLGNSRSAIAVEKAGIARRGRPLIIADADTPQSLYEYAEQIGADQIRSQRDIKVNRNGNRWSCVCREYEYADLPLPGIMGAHQLKNAAAAICAVHCLQSRLPAKLAGIKAALASVSLSGRFEKVRSTPAVYLDVAHNLASVRALRCILGELPAGGQLIGVLALQSNREIEPLITPLIDNVNYWRVAGMLSGPGHSAASISKALAKHVPAGRIKQHACVAEALTEARRQAANEDNIIVFGSFYTVSEARAALMYNSQMNWESYCRG